VQKEILDDKTLMLEYRLTDEASYVFAVTKRDFHVYPLPDRSSLNNKVIEVYKALTARQKRPDFEPSFEREQNLRKADAEFKRGANDLSRMLLRNITQLRSKKRLMIVADGALEFFPFAVLNDPATTDEADYLIKTHEIVYIPSASTLAVMRAGKHLPNANKQLVVIADPVYVDPSAKSTPETGTTLIFNGVGIKPLQFARKEAKAILALVAENQRDEFLGERATKQTASSDELAKYRLVHYAVHGVFDSEHPSQSGLVLSLYDSKGAPVTGGKVLTLDDVYNMKLSADLVTLSGCETALGQEVRGEGVIGLTRGYMYAGARRVLASIWIVNDESTSVLMERFYRRLLKSGAPFRPALALKAAQESMMTKSPYYWAGFVLQGEW
jgi:CHAT domain-containing protein